MPLSNEEETARAMAAMAIVCPKCGARPDRPCEGWSPETGPLFFENRYPHVERKEAACR
jgi:hypothetical protein